MDYKALWLPNPDLVGAQGPKDFKFTTFTYTYTCGVVSKNVLVLMLLINWLYYFFKGQLFI